jgi:hypothetical protein
VEFWPVAPLEGGSGSFVEVWLLRDRQFARTLLNRRNSSVIGLGDCGCGVMIPFSDTSGTIGFPPVARPRSSTMSSSGEVRQAAVLRACAVTSRRGRTSPSSKSSRRIAEWVHSQGIHGPQPNHGWRHRFKSIARDVPMYPDVSSFVVGHRATSVCERYGSRWVKTTAKDIALYPRYSIAALGSYRASCQRNSSSARRRRITP